MEVDHLLSVVLQPKLGLVCLVLCFIDHTHTHTHTHTQLVGLPWISDQLVTTPLPIQHTTKARDRCPFPQRDLNQQSNQAAVVSSLWGSSRDYRARVRVSSVVLHLLWTVKQENDKYAVWNGEVTFPYMLDSGKKSRNVLPEAATSATGFCCSCAMKPTTENMTKPANMLVLELIEHTIKASLKPEHIQPL